MLADIKTQVATYRQDHDLGCLWDDDLSYLLGQSLWQHEIGKLISGLPVHDKEFQMGCALNEDNAFRILRNIPEGHTFKGYPTQFNHVHTHRIFHAMTKAKGCREILLAKGDKVRFGLKIKVFDYGEHGLAVWILLAVRFKSL